MFQNVKINIPSLGLRWLCVLAVLFLLVGCGGGGGGASSGYTDLDAQYYQNDEEASTVVSAATVMSWVDAGLRTESGQRVVILDCVPNPAGAYPYSDVDAWFAGDAAKIKVNMAAQYGDDAPQYLMVDMLASKGLLGHIPGAIPSVSHEGYEVTARNDGPILAEHQVGTGALIDQMLQNYGVTQDDVIVLSTSRLDYPGFCPSRLWWTLYYWGFAKENILILNGGNKAYAMAGGQLEQGVIMPVIERSSFSVDDLAKRRTDARIGLGELMELIDSGRTALPADAADKVVVIDTRQPPVAYFFKDTDGNGTPQLFEDTINGFTWDAETGKFSDGGQVLNLSQMLFTDPNGLQIPFSATSNPPIDPSQAPASTYLGLHMSPAGGPLAIPLAPKPVAFEAIMKGAKIVKSPAYDITIPKLINADGSYKTREELLPIFAAAGIDGTKPIVTYCNSGALASIYFYVLQEVLEFDNVRMYDGSWQEWANLPAYEPATTAYVMHDDYVAYPMYPAGSPKLQFFAGMNSYADYDAENEQFVDAVSGAVIDSDIVSGGNLAGNATWDSLTRSEHILFRPMATLQDTTKTYKSVADWPSVETTPTYLGSGDEIEFEDDNYINTGSALSDDAAPTPFTPSGGGC